MVLSKRFQDAFKTALAMVLAYGIALAMDWDKPAWAGFAVAVISLATVGQSLNKGLMRMVGTVAGALAALAIISLFPQERWWFMTALSGFVGFCVYRMGRSRYPYAWNVAGFVSLIVALATVPATEYVFDVAVVRMLETGLGVLCFTLVTMLLWPATTGAELDAAVRGLAATQHRLYRRYRELLPGQAPAVPSPDDASAGAAADLDRLRAEEAQQLSQAQQALAGAAQDTYAVWELRTPWSRLLEQAGQVMGALARWHETFDEVRELDLAALLPDFPAFADELEVRFAQIERMLGGDAPDRLPRALSLAWDNERVHELAHFERAALALFRAQLLRLDVLTAAAFATVAEIKNLAPVGPAGQSSAKRPLSVPAAATEAAAPSTDRALDRDGLAAAVQVVAGLWAAYLLWLYVEVPAGIGLVILTGSLGIAVATNRWLPIRVAVNAAAVAFLFSALVYILVMPRLSGFAALGTLIFVLTFAIAYLFPDPRQVVARSAGLMIFALVADIGNEQSYSFLSVANLGLMMAIGLLILALAAHVPGSPQPEKTYVALLRRFFTSASFLVSTLRWSPDARPSRRQRRRLARHRQEVATLPAKLALWARFVPPGALGTASPEHLHAVTADVQALSHRLLETLDARAAATAAGVPQIPSAAALRREVDDWRSGLVQIFARLAADPDAGDDADFRSRLDTKLARLEAQIEQVLNAPESAGLSPGRPSSPTGCSAPTAACPRR